MNSSLHWTKSLGPFIFEIPMQNLSLAVTTFNKILQRYTNQKYWFHPFNHGSSEQYQIFKLQSLLATFE